VRFQAREPPFYSIKMAGEAVNPKAYPLADAQVRCVQDNISVLTLAELVVTLKVVAVQQYYTTTSGF
jgi:hypothetical protein